MERLTKKSENGGFYILEKEKIKQEPNGYSGEAVEKLAKLENLQQNLAERRLILTEELEKLKKEEKTHSYKFKELMAEKLIQNRMLDLLETFGLEVQN